MIDKTNTKPDRLNKSALSNIDSHKSFFADLRNGGGKTERSLPPATSSATRLRSLNNKEKGLSVASNSQSDLGHQSMVSYDGSCFENPAQTVAELQATIRKTQKMIKLAERNSEKDEHVANRIATENKALEKELAEIVALDAAEVQVTCSAVKEERLLVKHDILTMQRELARVHAEAQALEQTTTVVADYEDGVPARE